MSTFSLAREDWKSVDLGKGYTNENRLEVSNHGRVRTFNSTSNGKIITGSRINGYAIVRLKLFKPRDEKITVKVQQLQAAIAALTKKIVQINITLKGRGITAVERKALKESLEADTMLLKKRKSKYKTYYNDDLKSRTVYFNALVHRMVAEKIFTKTGKR